MSRFASSLEILVLGVLVCACLVNGYYYEPVECVQGVNCSLPKCNCDSSKIPVNLKSLYRLDELPQFVVLTFDDDGLDIKSYQVYRRLLKDFKNPNGCPIQSTFFVSDTENTTSYCLVRNLYDNRQEIAISTVNDTCAVKGCSADPEFIPWGYVTWTNQILEMRNRLKRYAGIPTTDVVGFRAPITQPASDRHYRIIAGHRFLYDSSLITNDAKIIWPYTLDYRTQTPLMNDGPIYPYPGLWELPIPINLNKRNKLCGKLWEDPCEYGKDEMNKFFRRHFLRSYYHNRSPLVLHLKSSWLKMTTTKTETKSVIKESRANSYERLNITYEKKVYPNLNGLMSFINVTLTNNKNVYFVSAQQAIEWMRMLPRIAEKWHNLTELVEEEILGDCHLNKTSFLFTKTIFEAEFDGKCDPLHLSKPDYNEDETIYLDDNDDELHLSKEKLRIKDLISLQSENLFVQGTTVYFIVILTVILAFVLLIDRLGKK